MRKVKQRIKQLSKREKVILTIGGVVVTSLVFKNRSLKYQIRKTNYLVRDLKSDLDVCKNKTLEARNNHISLINEIIGLGTLKVVMSQDKSKFKLEPIQEMIK